MQRGRSAGSGDRMGRAAGVGESFLEFAQLWSQAEMRRVQHAHHGVDFGLEQYKEMAKNTAGAMIISVNDHPQMRQIFGGLHMDTLAIRYTVGGGAGSQARELVIWNENCENRRRMTGTCQLF